MGRKKELQKIAKTYVISGLGGKKFDAIPYHEEVSLRAPINPGGSERPIIGRENLRNSWWAPLLQLVFDTTFIDAYVNEDESAVAVEVYCEVSRLAFPIWVTSHIRVL